jgi:hypothetical protein
MSEIPRKEHSILEHLLDKNDANIMFAKNNLLSRISGGLIDHFANGNHGIEQSAINKKYIEDMMKGRRASDEYYAKIADNKRKMTEKIKINLKPTISKRTKPELMFKKNKKPVKINESVKIEKPFAFAKAPLATGFTYLNKNPRRKTVNGIETISHTEFVLDLTASATANNFQCYEFSLNPANSALFPWLSNQAKNFAEYRFKELSFHFESSVSASTDGTFMVASSPDANDTIPATKVALMQYASSQRANVWEKVTHVVPKATLNRLPKYLTNDETSPAITFDLNKTTGKVFAGISAVPTASKVVGELYVTYEVEFYDPQPPTAASLQINSVITVDGAGAATGIFGGSVIDIGNIGYVLRGKPSDGGLTSTTTARIFKPGRYGFSIYIERATGAGTITLAPSFAVYKNTITAIQTPTTNYMHLIDSTATKALTYREIDVAETATAPWYLQNVTVPTFTANAGTWDVTTRIYELWDPKVADNSSAAKLQKELNEIKMQMKALKQQQDEEHEEFHYVQEAPMSQSLRFEGSLAEELRKSIINSNTPNNSRSVSHKKE